CTRRFVVLRTTERSRRKHPERPGRIRPAPTAVMGRGRVRRASPSGISGIRVAWGFTTEGVRRGSSRATAPSRPCRGETLRSMPALFVGGLPVTELSAPTLTTYRPYPVPIAAHKVNPDRLVIATGYVYESTDGGETAKKLGGFSGTSTRAIAFGSASRRNILY